MANYLIYDSNFKLLDDGSVNGNPLQDGKDLAEAILGAKVTFCSELFAKNVFKHLIVLSGAGTSVGLNLKAEGKDRGGLWTAKSGGKCLYATIYIKQNGLDVKGQLDKLFGG